MSSELDALYARRDRKYEEKRECESAIAELERKIDRLIKFKGQLDDYRLFDYGDASCLATNVFNLYGYPWYGEKESWLINYIRNTLCTDLINYENILGQMRDDLCDEITRLENEKYSYEGWLGRIKSALNSIANAIEKFFM
jgi:hypothetical protein